MRLLTLAMVLGVGLVLGWTLRGISLAGDPARFHSTADPGKEARAPAAEPRQRAMDPEALRVQELEAELERLIRARDFDGAVEFYARNAERAPPARAAALRGALLDRARGASGRQELELVLGLLERFTWYYHRDVEALNLLAGAAERLGRPDVALAALLDALEVELTGPDPDAARRRVASLVDALAAGRLAIDDRQSAIGLYERVLARDPLNHRYRYLLAAAQEAAGDYREALRTLDQIPDGGHAAVALADLRRRIEESTELASRFSDGLPLAPFGNHYTVEVSLDGGRTLRLLLDTGASRSVLTPSVIRRVRDAERLSERVRIGTANGVVSAARYRVPSLTLGPFRIDDPELVVLELEGLSGVDGLLGLDLLRQFDYRIDPTSGRLLLARTDAGSRRFPATGAKR